MVLKWLQVLKTWEIAGWSPSLTRAVQPVASLPLSEPNAQAGPGSRKKFEEKRRQGRGVGLLTPAPDCAVGV